MENTFKGAKRGGFIYTATLLLFLAFAFVGRLILDAVGATGTVFYAVSSLFSVSVLTVAVIISADKTRKLPYVRKFSYKFIVSALFLAFGMFLGFGFINPLVAEFVKNIGGNVSKITIPLDTPFQFVLFTVILCVLPAITEELFFRGVLLNSLSETGKTAGVLTVALCFALYHGNAAQLVYQFVYGVGLSVLALNSKSVIPCIIAHFINNFSVIAIEYFNIKINLFSPLIIIIGLILTLGFAAITCFSYKKADKNNAAAKESVVSFYLPFGAVGLAVAAALAVLSSLPL